MVLPPKKFQWSGKIPDDRALLHKYFQGELTFSNLVKMSSCLPSSLVDVEFNFTSGKRLLMAWNKKYIGLLLLLLLLQGGADKS